MNLDTLKNAGLTPGEIKIYEVLLDNGGQTAGNIIALAKLKRGDCYNKLYDLIDRGLVLESTKSKKKYFELSSPDAIEAYIEKQIENLATTQKEIKSILPSILSTYNLSYHKPGVKFFEGEEGAQKVIDDSLTASGLIYSYIDSETLNKYFSQKNSAYIKKRTDKSIGKRIIVADTESNRKHFHKLNKDTEVHFMDFPLGQFSTLMYIYDNKVSYVTLKPDMIIGLIIEDEFISKMQQKLFEYTWQQTKD